MHHHHVIFQVIYSSTRSVTYKYKNGVTFYINIPQLFTSYQIVPTQKFSVPLHRWEVAVLQEGQMLGNHHMAVGYMDNSEGVVAGYMYLVGGP